MTQVEMKIKKIIAMIDGATSEGEARAASLALQRLLAANHMTMKDINLNAEPATINSQTENVGKRVPSWVKILAGVIARNYRCRYYISTNYGSYDFWTGRHAIDGTNFVFVGEDEDAAVAAGCFRATKHAIETCFKKFCDTRMQLDGKRVGRKAGVKNSYCLGFIEGLEQSYDEQLEMDQTMALAVVVPESVERYMNEKLNLHKSKSASVRVSNDQSIWDSGKSDGYGFGRGCCLSA